MSPTAPQVADAFGLALMEAFGRLRSGYNDFIPEPIEFADGLLVHADARRYFAEPEYWPPLDDVAMAHATGRVLDVGAGAGRHALYLQRKGIDVVALEPSPGAARILKARGVTQVVVETIEQFHPGSAHFDVVLMLGNNLGLMRNLDEAPTILRRIAQCVPVGGLLVGDCGYPIVLFQNGERFERGDTGERVRIRYQDLTTEWFWYLFTTPERFQDAVVSSG